MKKILVSAIAASAVAASHAPLSAQARAELLIEAPSGLAGVEELSAPTPEELRATGKGAIVQVGKLVKTSVKAYSKVGWELGRLTSKHDPGPYPGFKKAVLPSLPKPGKKGR